MSDFLDRLALKAIGGDGLLAPRLPSLFEPAAAAPVIAPMASAVETTAGNHAPVRDDIPPSPTASRPELRSLDGTPPKTPPVAAIPPPAADRPPSVTAPVAELVPPAPRPPHRDDDRPIESPVRHTDHSLAPQPAPRRQVQAGPRHPTIPWPSRPPRGALLASASPVFAAPRSFTSAGAPDTRAGNARSRAALASGPTQGAGEPVVHVSIGRLEVRAAPAAASPSRHRDQPRPTSLDDYLRQRGKTP